MLLRTGGGGGGGDGGGEGDDDDGASNMLERCAATLCRGQLVRPCNTLHQR